MRPATPRRGSFENREYERHSEESELDMRPMFHLQALRSLDVDYEPDPAAMQALAARARHLGITLPASFVEWYGMRDGIALLEANSNGDDPIPIEQLGDRLAWRWSAAPDCVAEGRLLFMVESQAVSVWALSLNGGDDPPVLIARDPDLEWRTCAETFSTFIRCQVWDRTEIFDLTAADRVLLQAQDIPLQREDLATLRRRFRELTTTHGWPGDNQYRFERDDVRILIWDASDQADWWITTATTDLAALTGELWSCGGLHTSLWSDVEHAAEILDGIRARRRPR